MAEEPARLELARRYFTHFGPATIKDAAYFFGITKTRVKALLKELPVLETELSGQTYFYIDAGLTDGMIPNCLFLAGFDQLMLGYEKTESLFLSKEHMRDIFNLAGIVRPAILIDGEVAGWWNMKNRKLSINMFGNYHAEMITETANGLWTDIKKIEFQ